MGLSFKTPYRFAFELMHKKKLFRKKRRLIFARTSYTNCARKCSVSVLLIVLSTSRLFSVLRVTDKVTCTDPINATHK